MRIGVTLRILGTLLVFFSATLVPPSIVSIIYQDGLLITFGQAGITIFVVGAVLMTIFKQFANELRTKDGFLVTALCYFALGAFSALPLALNPALNMTWVDAWFESFSGLTTTGATVMTGLDQLPPSILYYRQQLQWLGGMGIIVLAVAILPMLGVGGMQLYRTEAPGPVKDSKLTPRIKQTALALWSIYVILTAACCLGYFAAGMSFFDAVCHSFSTVAIGGFSTHDASLGYFNSPAIEAVAIIFMLLSSINFALHFFGFRDRSLNAYWRDEELRALLLIMASSAILVAGVLISSGLDTTASLRASLFQVVSMFTTTGFATTSFVDWPGIAPFILIFGAFIGACAGSTGGGLKVIRVLLIYKQGLREIYRLIHPQAVFPIKLGQRVMTEGVIQAVWGFLSIYAFVFMTLLMVLLSTQLDFETSFSAVASAMNNLGPGLGAVSAHYGDISDTAKIALSVGMVLGRLEIFTVLVLFTGMFWRK